MMKVKLIAHSFKPGCAGTMGDIIDVSHEDAQYLLKRGAATVVREEQKAEKAEKRADETRMKTTGGNAARK